ncbi:MAG: hypothetical protein QOJ98_2916 [Acidobacteriota bacterium]|nr:hypothetical protein [Acidobacteriota bacterium]
MKTQPRVDPEHPWPALLSFREADQQYFGGRKEEVEALYRRIASSRLTLLFGLSGLGKSSLLLAGLFPRLRGERYFPVYIRLRYGRDLPPPVEQIKVEIAAQARASGIEAPEPRAGETLWQYFHRPDADFWDERNYPATPVLVFDQFEELFTKSREVAGQANEFIEELADLAEGASPALRYRLLIGIRSDYLAQLQGISDRVRAIFANRYELRRMSGAAALESTLTAGGHLLDEDVARRIVRFLAGANESGDTQSVDGLQVEPALLSLVCSELNATRVQKQEPKITASMLSGTKDEILSRFYEASFADVSPELRALVEDKLVTRDGKARNFISEQTARETAGVTDDDLARLVHRRLLRFEESGSSRRMELTHDLLTAVAAASRSTREQRRQLEEAERARAEAEQREESARRKLRRSRAAMLVFFVLLAAAVAGPFISARWTATGAKKVEADSAFRLAVQMLSSEEPVEGLAYLAHVIRLDPRSSAARTLLYEQLTTRTWPVPIAAFGPDVGIADAAFTADGARVAFRVGQAIEMWDVRKGTSIGRIDAGYEPHEIEFASDGATVLLAPGAHSQGSRYPAFWNPRLGRPMSRDDLPRLPGLADCSNMQVFDVSPDGHEVAVGCPGLLIVSLRGDGRLETLLPKHRYVRHVRFTPDPRFLIVDDTGILHRQPLGAPPVVHDLAPGYTVAGTSRDGTHVAIASHEGDVEIWDVAQWKAVGRFSNPSANVRVVFSPAGGTVMTTAQDNAIRLWNSDDWSRLLINLISHPNVQVAAFSRDGARIFTASDRMARWWRVSDGAPLAVPITSPKMLTAHLDGRGNIVTVSRGARVWQSATSVLPPATGEGVTAIGMSADRKTVLVQDEERMLAALDAATGKRRWTVPAQLDVVKFDRQLSRLIARKGETLSVIETGTWRLLWSIPEAEAASLQFSSDDAVLFIIAADAKKSKFVVRSAATGEPLAPPADATNGPPIALSRDGSLLAFRAEGKVVIWNVRQRRRESAIEADANVRTDFSPDGRSLATVSSRTGVRVWDIATGTARTMNHAEGETPAQATFSPDGRRLAVRSENGVAICDTQTFDCTNVLSHPRLLQLDFSPDGKRILTAAVDSVRAWDVATGLPLTLPLEQDPSEFVRWTDDGSVLFVFLGELRRLALPSIDEADTERLAKLGEALAGARIDHLGVTTPVDGMKALAELEKDCRGLSNPTCDVVRWFRTQPEKRTISPASKLTIREYVTRMVKDASATDWWRL